mmetsp:Transcript_16284/g.24547  ORF Transcript_16284/g.24547 Transcript_16284/m.24547 type:complete len:815 (+) Transcript_16284:1418-3862(+)
MRVSCNPTQRFGGLDLFNLHLSRHFLSSDGGAAFVRSRQIGDPREMHHAMAAEDGQNLNFENQFHPKESVLSAGAGDDVDDGVKVFSKTSESEILDEKNGSSYNVQSGKYTREDLLRIGKEKLKAWKSQSISAVSTANLLLTQREKQNRDQISRQNLTESRISDMERELRKLRHEKADLTLETQNLNSVINNFQEGLRSQESRVTELKQKQKKLLSEKAVVEGERDRALKEAADLREMLTQRHREIEVRGDEIKKSGASPRVDLTELLKEAQKRTSSALDSASVSQANLQEISKLVSAHLANLVQVSENLRMATTAPNLPPPPSGLPAPVMPGIPSGGRLEHIARQLSSVRASARAIQELVINANEKIATVNKGIQDANTQVSPEHVLATLGKSLEREEFGVRREEADIRQLIVEAQSLLAANRAQIVNLNRTCAFLRRERAVLSQRLSVREEESKMLIDSLKKTVSNLLSQPQSNSQPSARIILNSPGPTYASPSERKNVRQRMNNKLSDSAGSSSSRATVFPRGSNKQPGIVSRFPDLNGSLHINRGPRITPIRVSYGIKRDHRVHLFENVWQMPLNCRLAPSKESSVLDYTLEHGTVVVAEKRCNGWIKHARGWTEASDSKNIYMARLPLVETPLGLAYLYRKERGDGLSTVILTWCKGYGVMATVSTEALIKSIVDKKKASVTRELIRERGIAIRQGHDIKKSHPKLDDIERQLAELKSLGKSNSIAKVLQGLDLDPKGGLSLENVSSADLASEETYTREAHMPTVQDVSEVVVSEQEGEGVSGFFGFLLSIVGLDESDGEEEEVGDIDQ